MIDIRNLCVELGRFALRDISLKVETGEYFIILGPTGSGKTVLLETIAGIYPCRSGQIWLSGRNVTGLAPDARQVGIVYQDHALFPHLSVRENIMFGLRMRRTRPPELKSKLEGVVQLLGLGPAPAVLAGHPQRRRKTESRPGQGDRDQPRNTAAGRAARRPGPGDPRKRTAGTA